jgi:hypothetical protein
MFGVRAATAVKRLGMRSMHTEHLHLTCQGQQQHTNGFLVVAGVGSVLAATALNAPPKDEAKL